MSERAEALMERLTTTASPDGCCVGISKEHVQLVVSTISEELGIGAKRVRQISKMKLPDGYNQAGFDRLMSALSILLEIAEGEALEGEKP